MRLEGQGWNGYFFQGGVKNHGKIVEKSRKIRVEGHQLKTSFFCAIVGSPVGSGKKGEENTSLESADHSQKFTILAVRVFSEQLDFLPWTLYALKTNRWHFCWGKLCFPLERKSHQATAREMLGALLVSNKEYN